MRLKGAILCLLVTLTAATTARNVRSQQAPGAQYKEKETSSAGAPTTHGEAARIAEAIEQLRTAIPTKIEFPASHQIESVGLTRSLEDLTRALREPYTTAQGKPTIRPILRDYGIAISLGFLLVIGWGFSRRHHRFRMQEQRAQLAHDQEMHLRETHATLRLKAIDLHESFWNSSDFATTRQLIANDAEYSSPVDSLDPSLTRRSLAEVLELRTSQLECELEPAEYELLEKVDRFYSAILRLRRLQQSLATVSDDRGIERMIRDCYGYWVEILERPAHGKGNRTALKHYLCRFFPGVVGILPHGTTFGALQVGTNKTPRHRVH